MRKYTHVQALEPMVKAMLGEGKTRKEICNYFGLSMKQYENMINRMNRREAAIAAGKTPKPKGLPRKDGEAPQQSTDAEIKRLCMENQLLQDFLRAIGRE